MKQIDKDNGYKYLGTFEADKIKDTEIKEKTTKEDFERSRNIMK